MASAASPRLRRLEPTGTRCRPGRYVGSADGDTLDEPVEERLPKLVQSLSEQLKASSRAANLILTHLDRLQGREP